MRVIGGLATLLVILGAINYGLWGFFQFDFIAWIFHSNTAWWPRFCYSAIGVSGLIKIFFGRI